MGLLHKSNSNPDKKPNGRPKRESEEAEFKEENREIRILGFKQTMESGGK